MSIFAAALIALGNDGKLIHLALDISPPAFQYFVCQANATEKLTKKAFIRQFSGGSFRSAVSRRGGFVLIFTDGSSEKHPIVGDIAGYDYSECGITISAHVLIDQR